ncbi:MAG: hypothetical protein VYD19_02460, partial [Myxococcota bacterium]|nr:hypothetical protein [Myxococcota bacterium]
PESNEIVISDNCVGCTQCSKGCSFDAIQMHPVEGLDLAKYFPNRSPDARGKNIAQKCDNCTDYADQACITACPTGALFQIDGASLFESWEQFSVHERPGFEAVSSPEDRARRWRKWSAAFTILNLVILSYECLSRLLLPKLSIGWALMARSGADAVTLEAFSEKALSAGGTFGHSLGYIGGVAMILTQLYYLGRKLAPRFGSVQLWMELHVQLGFLAFIYGFYHTAFIWREPVAVATFALLSVAIISGVLGRYLLYHLPRNQSGQASALKEIRGELERLNQEMEARFKDRRKGYTVMIRLDEIQGVLAEESRARVGGEEESAAGTLARLRQSWRALRELVQSERRARTLLSELEPVVQGEAREGESERLLEMMGEKLRLEGALRRSERLFRALKAYRVVHVTVSHLSFIALGLHIFRSLTYAL